MSDFWSVLGQFISPARPRLETPTASAHPIKPRAGLGGLSNLYCGGMCSGKGLLWPAEGVLLAQTYHYPYNAAPDTPLMQLPGVGKHPTKPRAGLGGLSCADCGGGAPRERGAVTCWWGRSLGYAGTARRPRVRRGRCSHARGRHVWAKGRVTLDKSYAWWARRAAGIFRVCARASVSPHPATPTPRFHPLYPPQPTTSEFSPRFLPALPPPCINSDRRRAAGELKRFAGRV